MIRSFRGKTAELLFAGRIAPRFPVALARRAARKLAILDAASRLDDLRAPPGNHLELLHGHREGQHSIRINERWRICFFWKAGGAEEVEFVDYH